MICDKCGTENREDAAFCVACGAALPGATFSSLQPRDGEREKPEAVSFPSIPWTRTSSPLEEEKRFKDVTVTRDATARKHPQAPGLPFPEMPAGTTEATREARSGEAGETPLPEMPPQSTGGLDSRASAQEPYRVVSPGGFVFSTSRAAAHEGTGEEVGFPGTEPVTPSAAAGMPAGNSEKAPGGVEGGTPAPGETAVWTPEVPDREEGEEDGRLVYIPPESDLPLRRGGSDSAHAESLPSSAPEAVPPEDRTQAMEPVPDAGRVHVPQVLCPECYAHNPEMNRFCQECGNPLPAASRGRPVARRPMPAGTAYRPTATLYLPEEETAAGMEHAREGGRGEVRREKRFGAADALATVSAIVLAASLALPTFLEGFSYKNGVDLGIFSHQGAYVRGAYELLGGPGILPYRGVEFFTVGLVFAVALFLALLFLVLRVGRGPMFMLAGSLAALPLVYLFFQALLPLRERGVEIEPALGLGRLFFGGDGAPGLGPAVWMGCAAAILLILAGFLAPPRGWGRLFTFLVFFSLVLGAGFFCAACYNWNLFISEAAAGTPAATAPLLAAFL